MQLWEKKKARQRPHGSNFAATARVSAMSGFCMRWGHAFASNGAGPPLPILPAFSHQPYLGANGDHAPPTPKSNDRGSDPGSKPFKKTLTCFPRRMWWLGAEGWRGRGPEGGGPRRA